MSLRKKTKERLMKALNIMILSVFLLQPAGGPGLYFAFANDTDPVDIEDLVVDESESDDESKKSAEDGAGDEKSDETEKSVEEVDEEVADDEDKDEASDKESDEVEKFVEEVDEDKDVSKDEKDEESTKSVEEDKREEKSDDVVKIGEIIEKDEVKCKDKWEEKNEEYTRCVKEDVEYKLDFDKEDNLGALKITFTKIDEEKNKDNKKEITVKEVELTDEQVLELGALSNIAYDITSTMKNGSFEYDLVLPISEEQDVSGEEVSVVYIEDEKDLQKLDDENVVKDVTEDEKVKVEVDDDSEVTVENLDHMTIFTVVVGTFSDETFIVGKDVYLQGEGVYVKADNLHSRLYYRLAIDSPESNDFQYITDCQKGESSITGEYQLDTNATISKKWNVELHGFIKESSCNNANKTHQQSKNSQFEVKEVDFEKVRICHAQKNNVKKPFVSITPANISSLRGHFGIEHQEGRDIIPPIPTFLPDGQNWPEGEAIWGNDCSVPGGTMTLVKEIVKDNGGTEDATEWTLSARTADDSTVISGVTGSTDVTNAKVSVGTYMLSESGPNGYSASDWDCGNTDVDDGKIKIANGGNVTCTITNDDISSDLTVCKFDDVNGNGTKEGDESLLNNWLMTITDSENNFIVEGKTGLGGCVLFTDISAGVYVITETQKTGWIETKGLTQKITLGLDDSQTIDFGNQKLGTIIVHKNVLGLDGEDIVDTTNTFTVTLDGAYEEMLTDGGEVIYTGLVSGDSINPRVYTVDERSIPVGYELKSITPDSDANTPGAQVTVAPGETTEVFVVNRQKLMPPVQTGYNENNGDGAETPRPPNNEFACTGGVTYINNISVHWTHELEGMTGMENLKYERQFSRTLGGVWEGSEKYTKPYTDYRKFGDIIGTEGTYGSQVRAWIDSNNNGIIDGDEIVSDWSNECSVTYEQIEEIPAVTPECEDGNTYVKVNTEYENIVWLGNAVVPKNDWFELPNGLVTSTRTEGVVLTYDELELTVDLLKKENNARQDFQGTVEFYGAEVTELEEGSDFYKLENMSNCGAGCYMDDFSEISDTVANVDFAVTSAHDRGVVSLEQVEVKCDDICEPGEAWASEIIINNQGTLKNGSAITDSERTNPSYALGSPDGKFFSMGYDGSLTVGFEYPVLDGEGVDLSFHEVTWGRSGYPIETIKVEVSPNGNTWKEIGMVTNKDGGDGVGYLDFSETGWSWIQYVRITDITNDPALNATADGYDLDAIDAVYGTCEQLEPNEDIYGYKYDYKTGVSIENWPIELCRFEDANVASACTQIATTTTDSNGYYEFVDLSVGLYKVTEGTMPGYTQMAPTSYIVDLTGDTMKAHDNMIANGGFEAPAVGGSWNHYAEGVAGLGWDVAWVSTVMYDGYSRPEPARIEIQKSVSGWGDFEGDQYAELDTDWGVASGEPANIVLSQDIQTCVGGKYELHYAWSPRPRVNNNQMDVSWEIGTDSHSANGGSDTAWTSETKTFTANSDTTKISFTENGPENSVGMFLDGVEVVQTNTCPRGSVDFYNRKDIPDVQRGSITACKFEDADKDKQQSDGEEMITGWEMTLGNKTQTTDGEGCTTFNNLKLGKYTVTEEDRNGWEVTTGSLSQEVILGGAVEDYHKIVTFGNWYRTTDVTMCKVDDGQNPLPGWNLQLLGEQVESVIIPTNTGSVVSSQSLSEDDYVLTASGTYEYRGNSGLLTDANYSQRLESDDYTGPYFPWVNVNRLGTPGALGIMIGGVATNWSNYLAADNKYALGFEDQSGTFDFSIYDNVYTDNKGDLTIDINKGYAGTTGNDGCVTFKDVPYGDYTIDETLQSGWENIGGLGEVVVGEENNHFTISNQELLGDLRICKFNDTNGDGLTAGEKYIEWEVGVEGQESVDYNGQCYVWKDLPTGDYTVYEVEKDGWEMTTDNNNSTAIVTAGEMTTIEFGNHRLPVTISASKIVCTDESQLPNKIGVNKPISASTATDWVEAHDSCDFASDWEFEWGLNSVSVPSDDFVGRAGSGWTTFGPTGAIGIVKTEIEDFEDSKRLKLREVLQNNYLTFTHHTTKSDVSAEFYCANDRANYDNEEWINDPQYGNTYHCVAWNVPTGTIKAIKYEDLDGDGTYNERPDERLEGWTMTLYNNQGGMLDSGVTNNKGRVVFDNLPLGTYKVCETLDGHDDRWVNTDPGESSLCKDITVRAGKGVVAHFGNFELGFVSGQKWNDVNIDGGKSGEVGISDWMIVAGKYVQIGEYSIDSTSDTAINLGASVDGTYYVLKVSGTYGAGDQIIADAECSSRAGSLWNTLVKNYESHGEQLLDLEINGAQTEWGTCNEANHTYTKLIKGDGSSFSVMINDIYPSNNTGSLNVIVYRLDDVQTTTTSSGGDYEFADLTGGDYAVCEMHQDGWLQTYPQSEQSGGCHIFTVNSGTIEINNDFGNVELGSIHGVKWHDRNMDGEEDKNLEERLSGWKVFLDFNGNGQQDSSEPETQTSSDGEHYGWYWFDDLLPGEYRVCEVQQTGWQQTFPLNESNNCHTVSLPQEDEGCQYGFAENAVAECQHDFGNVQLGSITVEKQTVPDGALQAFNFTGDVTGTISDNGTITVENVIPGTYTSAEAILAGWDLTGIVCDDTKSTIPSTGNPSTHTATFNVEPGENVVCTFTNQVMNAEMTVAKYNPHFSQDPKKPEQVVNYEIVVEVAGIEVEKENGDLIEPMGRVLLENNEEESFGPIKNAKVVDLMPDSFEYVHGSYNAHSNYRGDLRASGDVGEPTYASPGTWSLGDLEPGEIITLAYDARIGDNTQTGTYPDMAFANGEDVVREIVQATPTGSGFEVENGIVNEETFVGTQIEVVADEQEVVAVEVEVDEDVETIKKEKDVYIDATTGLPATGAEKGWIKFAITILFVGILFLIGGAFMRIKRYKVLQNMKVLAFFITTSIVFSGAGSVFAATSDMVVRADEPVATSNTTFSFGYVVLDAQSRGIDVECLVQKPSSSTFETFKTVTYSGTGNSGDCGISGDVLSEQGIYKLKVRATTGSDVSESKMHEVVYNTTEPGKPKWIEKDKEGDCRYDVEFKTADDGQTVRVELYHSRDREFDVNEDSRWATVTVGPNEKKTVTDNLDETSVCNKKHWYAVRAFDEAGNASDVRVEEEEIEETKTVENVIIVETTSSTGAAVDGASSTESTSDADGTTGSESEDADAGDDANAQIDEGGEVAGETTGEEESFWSKTSSKWLGALLVTLGVIGGVYVVRTRKGKTSGTQNS